MKPAQDKKVSNIEGRSGTFASHRDATFIDVTCGKGAGKGTMYCVTSQGQLCAFSIESRCMEKWVDLKVAFAYALTVSDRYVACSCSDGIIR